MTSDAGGPAVGARSQLDGDATDFLKLPERDWARATCSDHLKERADAGSLALVLSPAAQGPESGPTVTAQDPKVIELQDPAGHEHLQSFLGKHPRSVGEVVNGSDRAILER